MQQSRAPRRKFFTIAREGRGAAIAAKDFKGVS
jgi:hypothetical protein